MANNMKDFDSNFKVETNLDLKNVRFYNCLNEHFDLYGVFYDEKRESFLRMPFESAQAVSKDVCGLNFYTSGGRIRFKTDSEYVAIKTIQHKFYKTSHIANTGTIGFDIVENKNGNYIYSGTFVPPNDFNDGYESVVHFGSKKMRDLTIEFPLYSSVNQLLIGIEEDSKLECGNKYKDYSPVVFYGSSITQGACASRPGTSYEAIISQHLDVDYINLGFSGNAKGEEEIANYVASLNMSVFVYDYDYNAPTVEHLKNTHERMFKIFRAKQPKTPVIFLSRPYINRDFSNEERRSVIMQTYANAVNSGDRNVYYIDGNSMYDEYSSSCSVDGVHPNDAGLLMMAKKIGDIISWYLTR